MEANGTGSYEIIIVGAGPAGQTAALYAGRSRIPTLVLERGVPGGELWNTAEVEDYPGFEHIMGPELADGMQKHAEKFGARFETAEVVSISPPESVVAHGLPAPRWGWDGLERPAG